MLTNLFIDFFYIDGSVLTKTNINLRINNIKKYEQTMFDNVWGSLTACFIRGYGLVQPSSHMKLVVMVPLFKSCRWQLTMPLCSRLGSHQCASFAIPYGSISQRSVLTTLWITIQRKFCIDLSPIDSFWQNSEKFTHPLRYFYPSTNFHVFAVGTINISPTKIIL